MRDLGSGLYEDFATSLTAEKIMNLVVIFAIFELADCAAEILVKFRSVLAARWDVEHMLDLLAAQAELDWGCTPGSYRRHMERFEQRPREFLGTKKPFAQVRQAFRKGYLKWRGRMQLLQLEREGG